MYWIIWPICLAACFVGSICGLGGGVIIKPALDLFGHMDVAQVSFLSGCTVLAMALYSVLRARAKGNLRAEAKVDTSVAVGAVVGGLAGKQLFSVLSTAFPYPRIVGCTQAAALFAVCLFTIVYTLRRDEDEVRECHLSGWWAGALVGVGLGAISAFLGIGGGPVNIVAMTFFFAMTSKDAAQASLYIILYSQTAATLMSLFTQDLSGIDPLLFLGMVGFGIAGAAGGRTLNAQLSNEIVDRMFIGLLVVIMGITIANFIGFAAI